jgi:hypothetical protein
VLRVIAFIFLLLFCSAQGQSQLAGSHEVPSPILPSRYNPISQSLCDFEFPRCFLDYLSFVLRKD